MAKILIRSTIQPVMPDNHLSDQQGYLFILVLIVQAARVFTLAFVPAGGIFKLLDAFAKTFHNLGDLTSSEKQQQGQHNENDLPWTRYSKYYKIHHRYIPFF